VTIHRCIASIGMCLTAFTLVLSLSSCGPAPTDAPPVPTPKLSAQAEDSQIYVIGPGDSLRVFVYQAPDLSGGVVVRPDGRISVPLVGDVMATGKNPTQLAKELEVALAKYVRAPTVTVIVNSFVGPMERQIRVIGEATQPKALNYRDGMTVLDVLIESGGLTKFAAGNRAVINRRAGGTNQQIRVRLSDLIKDGDISANVEMQPGDTLIIPQSWF
jgi:polysaccharide export outer membrane protein